jgi:hypothetical protein
MLIDTTPVATFGPATVLAEHRAVHWTDGSHIAVHHVAHAHERDFTHLALQEPRSRAWLVFEVKAVDPALATDLRLHHWADANGLVYFNLRLHFAHAGALVQAVLQAQAEQAVREFGGVAA